jgi:hypothetical protein
MIDSQSNRSANLSLIDEEGISLAWESAADKSGLFVGNKFGSVDDIPLECTCLYHLNREI